jgi:hypothetical protein
MMIQQHRYRVLGDEDNAVRTAVVGVFNPVHRWGLGYAPTATGRRGETRDERGLGGSTRGDVHRWG